MRYRRRSAVLLVLAACAVGCELKLKPTQPTTDAIVPMDAVEVPVASETEGAPPTVAVDVAADGTISVGGAEKSSDELLGLLTRAARNSPRDALNLPLLRVELSPDPAVEYQHVQDAIVQCMRSWICDISWKMGDERLAADLPRDHGDPPPPELRVRIYWANAKGQVIHNDKMAFPVDFEDVSGGVRVPLSLAGAPIAIQVGRVLCGDLADLERKLTVHAAAYGRPVVIDARRAVPFKWVFGALDACQRAGVKVIKFQAPPIEGGGGRDWWHM